MKSDVRLGQTHIALEAEEDSLRTLLLKLLPSVVSGGAQIFVNSADTPAATARYSHREADTLFASAQRCVKLRESLGLVGEAGVAEYFLAACRESASDDPHRRGPRKLAEWLLAKITT
jgi:hypothetical protein